jgi:hypothetical protein
LYALRSALDKVQKYPPDVLRGIEAQGNGLWPGTGGAPPKLNALWARA